MDKLLEINALTYKKNQQLILDQINLTLASGKIIALLGENGAGKTTLMRIICGLAKNYHGELNLAKTTNAAERKAKISFTDNLRGFSNNSKISAVKHFYEVMYVDFDNEQFEQLRQFMKLDLEMKLSQLSRGMREKLIIALTFARKADLYLLDEPFSGIDVMSRKKIINSIILWKQESATILISDHFVNEIASLLDEVVILKDKTVYSHQSADDIRKKHQSIEEYFEQVYGEDE